jgi:hypothetical protein
MVLRVSVWALIGLGVACGWMYYGMTTGAGQNIGGGRWSQSLLPLR